MEGFLRKFRGSRLPNNIMPDAPVRLQHRLARNFQLFNLGINSMGHICLGQRCCWIFRCDVHLVYHRCHSLRLLNNLSSIRLESCSSTGTSTSDTSNSCWSCDWSHHSSRWLRYICEGAPFSHCCTSVELWRLVRHSANSNLKRMGWLLL